MDGERSEHFEVAADPTQPPADLDEYVDWAMKWATKDGAGQYQHRALLLMCAPWLLISCHVYYFHFIAVEPDIGQVSGRTLLDVTVCTPLNISDYGSSCPELSNRTCGPQGPIKTPEFRDLWTYRSPENSAVADFDMAFCSENPNGRVTIGSAFWGFFGAGVIAGGVISDRRGRRFAWILTLLVALVGAAIVSWSPRLPMFAAGRCMNAFGLGGASVASFVWTAESMNFERLVALTLAPNLFWGIGGCLPALLTLGVTEWRFFSWVMVAIGLPLFIIPPFMQESPKWLASKGRREAVGAAMAGIAAVNGQPKVPPPPTEEEVLVEEVSGGEGRMVCHRLVLPRLVFAALLWFVVGLAYFGVTELDPPDSGLNLIIKDPHPIWIWCFGFLLELPAYALAACMIEWPSFGRKRVAAGGIFTAGVLLLIVSVKEFAPVNRQWIFSALFLPARLFMAGAFGVLYCWMSELFPNSIRNSVIGVCSFSARLGAALSPWVVQRATENDAWFFMFCAFGFPLVLMGMLASWQLPETRGKTLPGYIQDNEF